MTIIQGEVVEVPFTITDADTNTPVDPTTLHFLVKAPDDTVSDTPYPDVGITRTAVGEFIGAFNATQAGRYQWRVVTTGAGQGASQGYVDVQEAFSVAFAPTVEDMAVLMPARTATRLTGPLANNPSNTPSFADEDRVQSIIDMATSIVSAQLGGTTIAEKFRPAVRYLVVLQAAMMLEPSAWPEQARPDKSAWEQWKLLYDEGIKSISDAIVRDTVDGDDGDGGPDSTERLLPQWAFPPAYRAPAARGYCWPDSAWEVV